MNGPHARTLALALKTVGTKAKLATALAVPLADLEHYLSGDVTLPHQVFIDALEIVANGPHGPR